MEELEVARRLRMLNGMVRRYLHSLNGETKTGKDMGSNGWILGYLADHADEDVYQKTIEDHFILARSTTSRLLSALETHGLIVRSSVESDARLKKIELTDKAKAINAMMYANLKQLEANLLKGFSDAEKKDVVSYLDRMRGNLSEAQQQQHE